MLSLLSLFGWRHVGTQIAPLTHSLNEEREGVLLSCQEGRKEGRKAVFRSQNFVALNALHEPVRVRAGAFGEGRERERVGWGRKREGENCEIKFPKRRTKERGATSGRGKKNARSSSSNLHLV